MTKEEKELLLKELCAMLPYGVKIRCAIPFLEEEDYPIEELTRSSKDILTVNGSTIRIEEIKPYLRPLRSMTEDEQEENERLIRDISYKTRLSTIAKYMDWLLAHHFDIHGLIEKGLALEAPEGSYEKYGCPT